jgi:hypothetical protein
VTDARDGSFVDDATARFDLSGEFDGDMVERYAGDAGQRFFAGGADFVLERDKQG